MRRGAVAATALAGLLAACGGGVDQGGVRACFNTIGLSDDKLLSIDGWRDAANQALAESRDGRIQLAAQRMLSAIKPYDENRFLTGEQKEIYTVAARAFVQACRDAGAFEGDPLK